MWFGHAVLEMYYNVYFYFCCGLFKLPGLSVTIKSNNAYLYSYVYSNSKLAHHLYYL